MGQSTPPVSLSLSHRLEPDEFAFIRLFCFAFDVNCFGGSTFGTGGGGGGPNAIGGAAFDSVNADLILELRFTKLRQSLS